MEKTIAHCPPLVTFSHQWRVCSLCFGLNHSFLKRQKTIHDTLLHDYYFIWPGGGCAIALGYGSLYNHSSNPNAIVIFDEESSEIIFQCISTIKAGTEILYDYTGGEKSVSLWFNEL